MQERLKDALTAIGFCMLALVMTSVFVGRDVVVNGGVGEEGFGSEIVIQSKSRNKCRIKKQSV
mgnify:CR=1 FL=1